MLVASAVALAVARAAVAPDGFEDRDGLYFARGVERYSMEELRPFWPGYPVYIGLGRLAAAAAGDVSRGLHILSALASGFTLLPIVVIAAELARRTGTPSRPAALLAAVLWAASPLAWAVGSQVFSESPALFFVLSAIAVGLRGTGIAGAAAMGALAGLGVGCRPPYAVLVPAVAAAHPAWDAGPGRRRTVFGSGAAFALTCAAWLGWQLVHEGPFGYARAARTIIVGFLYHHGGGMLTDPGLGRRLARLAETTCAQGFAAWPAAGAPTSRLLVIGLVLAAALAVRCLFRAPDALARRLVATGLLTYGGAVVIAHHPGYARYVLPLVALFSVVLPLALPRCERRAWPAAIGAGVLVVAAAGPIVSFQARHPVLGLEVTRWLQSRSRPVVVVSLYDEYLPFFLDRAGLKWERSKPDALGERATAMAREGQEVFSTLGPSQVRPEAWTLAAEFQRGDRVEPQAPREVVLFRLTAEPPPPGEGALP